MAHAIAHTASRAQAEWAGGVRCPSRARSLQVLPCLEQAYTCAQRADTPKVRWRQRGCRAAERIHALQRGMQEVTQAQPNPWWGQESLHGDWYNTRMVWRAQLVAGMRAATAQHAADALYLLWWQR